jgi:hypothetical protein
MLTSGPYQPGSGRGYDAGHVTAELRLPRANTDRLRYCGCQVFPKKAVEKYLGDAEARHLAAETVRKRRELPEGKLLPFGESKGYSMLAHLDVDVLRTFGGRGPISSLSVRKRLDNLICWSM